MYWQRCQHWQMRNVLWGLFLLAVSLCAPGCVMISRAEAPVNTLSTLPLIENVGQFADDVHFQMWGGGQTVWLDEGGLWISLEEQGATDDQAAWPRDIHAMLAAQESPTPRQGVNLHLRFVDANPDPTLEPFDRLDTTFSYILGNDPDGWYMDVPVWGGVRYRDLYPGIDLEVTGVGGQLTQRLVLAEGADLSAVRLQVEGADELTVFDGAVRLETTLGAYDLPLLQIEDVRATVALPQSVEPQVHGDVVTMPFDLAPAVETLDVSPEGGLVYSAYLGGYGTEHSYAIDVDDMGRAYVAGCTDSPTYPVTPGAYDPSQNGSDDVFVSVLDPTGVYLVASTFLGGSGHDCGYGVQVDRAGRVYVAGVTNSLDFPATPGAYDSISDEQSDVFVTALDHMGTSLVYSTLLGGTGPDVALDLAVSGEGEAYVTGFTLSVDYPVTGNAYETDLQGETDVFVSGLDPLGRALVYSTLLGGSENDDGGAIALDAAGQIYVTGHTSSEDYVTSAGAYDTTYNGRVDAFVTALSPATGALIYSSFLGGGNYEVGYGIAVSETGRVFVAGETSSEDYPTTPGAYDTGYNNSTDAFAAAFDPMGMGLVYSVRLGGSDWEQAWGVTVDAVGRAYLVVTGCSDDYPTTPGAHSRTYSGSDDIMVSVLDAAGTGLLYSTYLGGVDWDFARDIAMDEAGRVYVTGDVIAYPHEALADQPHIGRPDAYVAALDLQPLIEGAIAERAPLSLTAANGNRPPQVGDLLVGHVLVQNVSGGPLHVEQLGVRGLKDGAEPWDFGLGPLDLDTDEVWECDLQSDQPLEAGAYAFWVGYSLDGVQWAAAGPVVSLSISALPPAYTVAGQVTDGDGIGVEGVEIAAGDASAMTDAGGHYALEVAAGQQVLTPAKPGYSFEPALRRIEVTGNLVDQDFVATATPGHKPWLVMYYLAGDNELDIGEGDQQSALQYLTAALHDTGGSPAFDLAVLYDGQGEGDTAYHWLGDEQSYIPMGELDLTDPNTLADFMAWARGVSSHEYELLVLWGHGSLTQVLRDCSGEDCGVTSSAMPLADLEAALAQGAPVDVLWMDNPLSGSIEAAYQLRARAGYYVGSESAVWAPTPPRYLSAIGAHTTPDDLARGIARDYAAYWRDPAHFLDGTPRPFTISVTRLANLPELASQVGELAQLLNDKMDTVGDPLLRARVLAGVQRYDSDGSLFHSTADESIDLYDLTRLIYELSDDAELRAAAQAVMQAIQDAPDPALRYVLLSERQSGPCPDSGAYYDLSGSYGVSIFWARPDSRRSLYTGEHLSFAEGTDWGLVPAALVEGQGNEQNQWGPMLVRYAEVLYSTAADDGAVPPLQAPLREPPLALHYLSVLGRTVLSNVP